jgi:hypothetical protein
MTRAEDVPFIRKHPAWRRLSEICTVEIRAIDDLIVDGNHHVTITLAYAQAVRAAGDTMCDTCFVFLVSDCLLADGSLAHVLSRVQAGASGVVTGHLQIVAESAAESFARYLDPRRQDLVLAPRALMRVALAHLHPTTMGSMVNREGEYYANANRLFWSVDAETLVARFYLMHMAAIRPEIADFVVGASCDYSFIPEMCPSGRVAAIADSDDYLAVEMQPRNQEARHCHPGRLEPKKLARAMSDWTTAEHRENARQPLIFHGAEVPAAAAGVQAEADDFVASVGRHLSRKAHPHRNHPYWMGAVAAHAALGGCTPPWPSQGNGSGVTPGLRDRFLEVLWRLRFAAFGRPPDVRAWHPRWPDFRLPFKAVNLLAAGSDRLLVVSNAPGLFAHWLKDTVPDIVSVDGDRVPDGADDVTTTLAGGFGVGLLVLLREQLDSANAWIDRISVLLRPGGALLVVVTNHIGDAVEGVDLEAFRIARGLFNAELRVREIRYVPESRLRRAVQRMLLDLTRTVRQRPSLLFPLAAAGALLAGVSVACNYAALLAATARPRRRSCSSVFMVIQLPERASRPARPTHSIQIPA